MPTGHFGSEPWLVLSHYSRVLQYIKVRMQLLWSFLPCCDVHSNKTAFDVRENIGMNLMSSFRKFLER